MKTLLAFTAAMAFTALAGRGSNTGTAASPSLLAKAAPTNLQTQAAPIKSPKRGIAYDLGNQSDLGALSNGVSWWYNWSSTPNGNIPASYATQHNMDFYPMLWNGNFQASAIEAYLKAHTNIKYLLVLNEPNVGGQAYLTPQQAAQLWPQYEAVASATGVKIVGPQITWGTMPGYSDPVTWMDAFYSSYQSANGGRSPRIDYLGFHWYDYGIGSQLDRLTKYGKPFWVTEFANWHSQNDGAQIDTLAKQETQMKSMVDTLENRSDVFRYAWFTGRVSGTDVHFDSLLSGTGQLTDLGKLYVSLPYNTAAQ